MDTCDRSIADIDTSWQKPFTRMLPTIEQLLRIAFRDLRPEARDAAIEDGRVHSLLSYLRLYEQGRAGKATPSTLVWYAAKHIRRGRSAGCRLNGKEPLSPY